MRTLSPAGSSSSAGTTTISQDLLLSLRHDFPTEWAAFVDSATTATPAPFTATLSLQHFPYAVQYALQNATPGAQNLQIDAATLYTGGTAPNTLRPPDIANLQTGLNNKKSPNPEQGPLTLATKDYPVMVPDPKPRSLPRPAIQLQSAHLTVPTVTA
jgi:hypothetical protein